MNKEGTSINAPGETADAEDRRREALQVLLEARERLLSQMTEDILAASDVLLDRSQNGLMSFEFQEIEDRYASRLTALNSLLEQFEYRQPKIRYRVESMTSSQRTLKRDLGNLLKQYEEWDLVNFEVLRGDDDQLQVVAVLTADEYPE
jgi:hypothetical protein